MGADTVLQLLRVAGMAFVSARVAARVAIVQAMLTTFMLVGLYAGFMCVRDGSVTDGLRDAFLPARVATKEDEKQTIQTEMRQVAQSDRVIRQVLQGVLGRARNASRVRLAVVHNGVTGISGVSLLRFDVTHGVAAAGRDVGPFTQNQPLSNWSEYLNTMLANQCALIESAKLQNANARARLMGMSIRVFMACPVIDPSGQMLGGIFVSWDGRDDLPTTPEIKKLMDDTRDGGRQLATALDLRSVAE